MPLFKKRTLPVNAAILSEVLKKDVKRLQLEYTEISHKILHKKNDITDCENLIRHSMEEAKRLSQIQKHVYKEIEILKSYIENISDI